MLEAGVTMLRGVIHTRYLACPYSVTSAVHSLSGTFIHVSSTSIESQASLDGMTLWLSFGSYKLGLVLPCPLVGVSHRRPATYWFWQSLSLTGRNGSFSECYQACPGSVTSA